MSLDIQLWALARGAAPDEALPDLGDYTITPIAGDVGAISIDYPRDGLRFARLRAVVDEDRPVEVEARTDGTAATALRYLLFTAAGDDIKPGAVWTFTGYDLGILLADYVLPYNTNPALSGNDRGETSFSANAGTIMRTLMQRAQAAGFVLDIGFASFSTTLDSRGAAWAKSAAVSFPPGASLVDVLRALFDAGLAEWEVTAGRQLRLYNPGTRGTDRSLPGPGQLTLEHGRDIADAPVRHDVTGARTDLTTSGKDGLYSAAQNTTAAARIGWRRGGYQSFGNVADQGSLDAVTQLAASTGGDGADEQTHALVLERDSVVVPGRDFQVGDWLLRGVNGSTQRRQVARYTLSRRGREITAAVTLGDLIASRAARVQRQIDAIAKGSTVVGTSSPQPDVDDGKAPAAPTGLIANSIAYYDGGTPLAQVTAAWTAVTTNADGTALDDLQGYEVEYRYQAGQGLPTGWQTAALVGSTTSVSWSPVVAGRTIDIRVLAVDKYGRESAYSAVYSLATATDAAAPPVPSTPVGSAYLGILKWDFNGKGSAGEAMPTDTREVELHLSTVSGFIPDRPLLPDGRLDTALSTTYRDRFTGAGELPVDPGGAYGVTWFGRLVAVDKSNNASAASAQGSAVRVQAQDGDLAGLNVGKLITGIMSALLTISGIIRTAAAGARVELDTTGLRCISSTGAVLFEFHIPTSLLTMVGRLVAGAGVGLGATVVVDPSIAALDLHPDATTQRTRIRARSTGRPDGTTAAGLEIDTLNASGQTDGFSLSAWSTNLWIGHRLTTGLFSGGRAVFQRIGGLAGLFSDNGSIVVDNTVARMDHGGASVAVESDGDVIFAPAPGRSVDSATAFGTLGAGFSQKAQNGYSLAGYRMVVDGGANTLRFVDNQANAFVGDGSGGLKSFVIPHPVDSTRWLVHGCTEAPEAGVEYRGVAEIRDGRAEVELPPYFEAAVRAEGRTVHVTMLLPDEPLAQEVAPPPLPADRVVLARQHAVVLPEQVLLHPVAASLPREGRFRIASPAPDGTRVAWLVKAQRADVAPLEVEPRRDQVTVRGEGPYRYIAPAGSSAAPGSGASVGLDVRLGR